MKKTYQKPETLAMEVGTSQIVAESLTINRGGESVSNSNQILVKKRPQRDNNIWDNEW